MRAYAPGSITGLFAPAPPDGDDTSMGASFAIADGVTVDVRPASETTITIAEKAASLEPVTRLLNELGVQAEAAVTPVIPLGHGFGASGAATLATAIAAAEEFGLDWSRDRLVHTAHRAELAAGTGQGDVFIQDRGGIVWSTGGKIDRCPVDASIEYSTAGGMATSEILADEELMATARRAGIRHLERLPTPPTLESLATHARAYLEETGFATPFVNRELARVDASGGTGSMALFGESVFAVGVEGTLANQTTVASDGARLVED